MLYVIFFFTGVAVGFFAAALCAAACCRDCGVPDELDEGDVP